MRTHPDRLYAMLFALCALFLLVFAVGAAWVFLRLLTWGAGELL